jgi:hypothetical protein
VQATPVAVTISIGKIYALLANKTRSTETQFPKPANTRALEKFRRNFEIDSNPRRFLAGLLRYRRRIALQQFG